MRRRQFISLLGVAAASYPFAARAQQAERMRRVGVRRSTTADDVEGQARIGAFLQGLRQKLSGERPPREEPALPLASVSQQSLGGIGAMSHLERRSIGIEIKAENPSGL